MELSIWRWNYCCHKKLNIHNKHDISYKSKSKSSMELDREETLISSIISVSTALNREKRPYGGCWT